MIYGKIFAHCCKNIGQKVYCRFEQEKQKDEKKRKEEDYKRQMEKKDIKDNHEKEMEGLKKSYEKRIRKEAENSNNFKEKYEKEYAAHQNQMRDIVKCVIKKKQNIRKISVVLKIQEEAMKKEENEEEKRILQVKHEEEMDHLLEELLKEGDSSWCMLL